MPTYTLVPNTLGLDSDVRFEWSDGLKFGRSATFNMRPIGPTFGGRVIGLRLKANVTSTIAGPTPLKMQAILESANLQVGYNDVVLATEDSLRSHGLLSPHHWNLLTAHLIMGSVPDPEGVVTISNIELEVTTAETAVPPAPAPPTDSVVYACTFITAPPVLAETETAYSCITGVRRTEAGSSIMNETGTMQLEIQGSAGMLTNGFVSSGEFANITTAPLVSGNASFNFTFSTASTGISSTTNPQLKLTWVGHSNAGAAYHQMAVSTGTLKFSTQPSAVVAPGDNLGAVQVTRLNSTGGVNLSFDEDVTISAVSASGANLSDQTILVGAKVLPGSSGVADFTSLTFSKDGQYKLKATDESNNTVLSDLVTVIGPPDDDEAIGLRQNILNDGTEWRKTTGISAPTFATPSIDELNRINGDLTTTAGVGVDGFRMYFPFWMRVRKVSIKGELSTLTNASIEIYGTQNATSATSGTWTEVASTIPPQKKFQRDIEFAEPEITKGLWVTLNDGGGAATAVWQAIHVYGSYVNPSLSIINVSTAGPIGDEEYLSIPTPPEVLEGARIVTRDFLIRNGTDDVKDVTVFVEAARYGGDALADGTKVELLTDTGAALPSIVQVPAGGAYPIKLRYTISAAENDSSGDHYSRLSFADGLSGDRVLISNSTGDAGSLSMGFYKLDNGSRQTTFTPYTSGTSLQGHCVDWKNNDIYVYAGFAGSTGGSSIGVRKIDAVTGTTKADLDLIPGTYSVNLSDMAFAGDHLHITTLDGGVRNKVFIFNSTGGFTGSYSHGGGGESITKRMISTPDGEVYAEADNGVKTLVHLTSTGGFLHDTTVAAGFAYWYDGVHDKIVSVDELSDVLTLKRFNRDLTLSSTDTVDILTKFGHTVGAISVRGIIHKQLNKEYLFMNTSAGNATVYACPAGQYSALEFQYNTQHSSLLATDMFQHIDSEFPQ